MNNSFRYALLLLIASVSLAHAGGLAINSIHGEAGDTVTFAVAVDDAPNQVKALIMDVKYNPDSLTFEGYQRGELGASGYPMMIVNEYKPGTIRVGAADPLEQGISPGDTGNFLYLTFTVSGDSDSDLSFGALKDDFEFWSTSPGYLIRDDLQKKSEEDDNNLSESEDQASKQDSTLEEEQETQTNEDTADSGGLMASASRVSSAASGTDASSDPETYPQDINTPLPFNRRTGKDIKSIVSPDPKIAETKAEVAASGKPIASEDKIAEINNFRNDRPVVNQQAGKNRIVESVSLADEGKRQASNQPLPVRSMRPKTEESHQAENKDALQERIPGLVVTLLVVVLAVTAMLLVVMAAILVMMILIYLKFRSLEKSGQLVVHGPIFSMTHTGKETHSEAREQYLS